MAPMGRAWQVWMKSKQRREERSTPATILRRIGLWMRSIIPAALAQRAERRPETRMSSHSAQSRVKRESDASHGRSSPADFERRRARMAVRGRIAAKSLLKKHRDQQLDGICPGVHPQGQASAFRLPPQLSSGDPLLHFPANCALVHPAVPRVPVATRSRTERYDGKRDLYFQHAA
jgi:hypothetical protein